MRGYLWQNLAGEIAEEFAQFSELPTLAEIAHRTVPGQILYRMWNAREISRLPKQLRAALVRRTRSDATSAFYAEQRRLQPAKEPVLKSKAKPEKKKRRPRIPPAPTKYQLAYEKRKYAMRERLLDTRSGLTLHFTIITKAEKCEHEHRDAPDRIIEVDGYVSTGTYNDGRLGEFFIRVSKEVASLGPSLDAWAVACSMALQSGVPVRSLLGKFTAWRCPPEGPVTGVPGITKCTSPLDLISRWLIEKYGEKEEVLEETVPTAP